MLINIDRYEPYKREWQPHGHLELETAFAIYSTQHHMAEIERQLNEYGVYRTRTTYSTWEWDEEHDEDFEVISTYAIRFTVSQHNKKAA